MHVSAEGPRGEIPSFGVSTNVQGRGIAAGHRSVLVAKAGPTRFLKTSWDAGWENEVVEDHEFAILWRPQLGKQRSIFRLAHGRTRNLGRDDLGRKQPLRDVEIGVSPLF